MQRYPIPGQRRPDYNTAQLYVAFFLSKQHHEVVDDGGGAVLKNSSIGFATDASFAVDTVPLRGGRPLGVNAYFDISRPRPLFVAGPHTLRSVRQVPVIDKTVLYVPPVGGDTAVERQVIEYLVGASAGVVIPVDEDSATFARRRARAQRAGVLREDYLTGEGRWGTYVRASLLAESLAGAGLDLAHARTVPTPVMRELLPLGMWVRLAADSIPTDTLTAPNVMGVIVGSDSVLRNEYLLITTRLDQGSAPADDNTSGVAGLLALARAYRQPGARPRRSIVLAAVSGSRPGLWGSHYLATSALTAVEGLYQPGVLVGSLDLDQIGAATGDSVVVDGLGELKPAKPLAWLAGEHPELHLTVVEGGSVFDPTADPFVFARQGVPVVSFRGRPGRGPGTEDGEAEAERTARVAALAFYTGQAWANGESPRWSDVGRRRRARLLEENP